jgi:P-type Ca2+ transporter type 2C
LQFGAVAVPGLRSLLGTTLPSPMDMAVIAAGSGLPFLVNEATKARMHRFNG